MEIQEKKHTSLAFDLATTNKQPINREKNYRKKMSRSADKN